MKTMYSLLACVALWGSGVATHAAVVTFEPDDFVPVLNDGDSHSVEGFDFKLQSGRAESFFVSGLNDANYVNNGSKNLFVANQANLLVSSSLGRNFDLLSFDLGGSFVNFTGAWADTLTVVGHTDSGDLMLTVSLPDTPTLSTITFNWFGLRSFELRANGTPVDDLGPDFVIDNIRLSVIPEPASSALVLLALAGLAAPALRKRVR